MRRTDLPMALVFIGWIFLLWSGIDGLLAIKAQQVPGYPVIEQYVLYAGIPATALVFLVAFATASRRGSRIYPYYPAAVAITAFALLPTLRIWGGGV